MSESVMFNVGDGATVHGYSDAYAYTVIAVSKSGKQITMQRDSAELLNGPESGEPDALRFYSGGFAAHVEGIQRYKYSRNKEGQIQKASLRKNGKWYTVGRNGSRVTKGRHEHYDYNF